MQEKKMLALSEKKAPFLLTQCSSAGLVKPRKENPEAFLSEIGHTV